MTAFIVENFWLIVMCILLTLIDARLALTFVAIIILYEGVGFWVMLAIVIAAWCLGTYRNQFWNWLAGIAKENENGGNADE